MKPFFTLYLLLTTTLSFSQQLTLENLGPNVNTPHSELNPIISANGRKLYFIRSDHPENNNGTEGSQDIWYAELDSTGTWGKAIHAPRELNRGDYNTLFNVSPDENQLLIGGAFDEQIFWGIGFSMIRQANNKWQPPKYLDIKKFDKLCRGEYSSACMGADNKVLILSFSEKEYSKVNNLYVSFLQPNGKWSEPVSLGHSVNTAADETTPFLAADGVTLYFSSDRYGGLGLNDIYMTKRLDSTWRNWSKPVNLGSPVNSAEWEGYYSVPAAGNIAYLVSYKNSLGKADIFKVRTSEATKPKPVVLVNGRVFNAKTGNPIEADITYEELPTGAVAGRANYQSGGIFNLVLIYGKNYGIIAKAEGFIPVSVNIDLRNEGGYTEMTKNLMMVPIEKGQIIRLNNIFFNTGKSDLKAESYPELERLAELLLKNPNIKIEISGHTDDIGNEMDNLILSETRARAVYLYLLSKGVYTLRLVSRGYGEARPIAENNNDENRQLNRRVEFKILEQ